LPLGLASLCADLGFVQRVPAQEITGTPGSPGATTTINGSQIPAPPQPFAGRIEKEATKSTPYWPARITPPRDAPNVLLIITDDAGYGVPGTFGGVILTPALDRIASEGLRYTNFHTTAPVFPHARRPDYRSQSPFGWLWRHRRASNGLSGLR
jgi:hypothetical protein